MCLLVLLQVATQFFSLQVVLVFLASFITGSLLNQLALLLNNPGDVLRLLGTGGWDPPALHCCITPYIQATD
jgi:hypothetical protein